MLSTLVSIFLPLLLQPEVKDSALKERRDKQANKKKRVARTGGDAREIKSRLAEKCSQVLEHCGHYGHSQACMSLRAESIRVYRQLYRAASRAAEDCSLSNAFGLQRYVSLRFQQDSDTNQRQLSAVLAGLERSALGNVVSEKGGAQQSGGRRQRDSAIRAKRHKLLIRYQDFVSKEIDGARTVAEALPQAAGNSALTSVLQAISAGVGSAAYQRIIESNFLPLIHHDEKCVDREEVAEDATSERQNRIMQQSLIPYAERLLLAHRTAIGEQNCESDLLYLSPWQVTEAIVGSRSGVSAVHLRVGRDHLVVEVDETYNKQIVYICCTRRESADSGSYEWSQEVERVEVSESEEVQRTVFHSEWLFTGSRLCDTLVQDSPLHPTRKTVLVGHGVGGAVAMVVALLLSQRGFDVANVVTLGAPKVLQGTLERYISAVNPIRVVMAGDPLVELPVTGAEGVPFVHVGEILLLTPHLTGTAEDAATSSLTGVDGADTTKPDVQDEEYAPEVDSSFTADDLGSMLDNEDPIRISGTSTSTASLSVSDQEEVGPNGDLRGERLAADDSGVVEEDIAETLRTAQTRYAQQFLVEHYVKLLCDPQAKLTYAEGDEVWDAGDYEAMKDETQRHVRVTAEEQRIRNLRGPL